MKVAREGIPIIIGFAVAATAISWVSVWFFRDPERRTPSEPGAVICPADGVVCGIGQAEAPADLGLAGEGPFDRVCVFMNVFNVHSNRSPVDAEVVNAWYRPGAFVNADLDKASEENERNALHLRTPEGRDVTCVQVAGLIARRILCYVKPGDRLARGQRYGFIRFGSRVDVYVPAEAAPVAAVGDVVYAAESILAEFR